MPKDYVSISGAETPGGLNERHLSQLQNARANHTRRGGPPEGSDNDNDIPDAGAGMGSKYDHERQGRYDEDDIGCTHENFIRYPAQIAREEAHKSADGHRNECGEETDEEGNTCAEYKLAEDILADIVGAEGMCSARMQEGMARLPRVIWSDERREEGQQDEEGQQEEAGENRPARPSRAQDSHLGHCD